jgi:hypothetical protein
VPVLTKFAAVGDALPFDARQQRCIEGIALRAVPSLARAPVFALILGRLLHGGIRRWRGSATCANLMRFCVSGKFCGGLAPRRRFPTADRVGDAFGATPLKGSRGEFLVKNSRGLRAKSALVSICQLLEDITFHPLPMADFTAQ